jgi:hypothetical protein
MKNKYYEIIDLEQFVESTRVLVFDSFGKTFSDNGDMKFFIKELSIEDISELNTILTQSESMLIAKEYIKQTKNKIRISDKQYMALIESLNSRMVSNMLKNLVSQNILESAYDSESNDFIFWIKENNEEVQKPEAD